MFCFFIIDFFNVYDLTANKGVGPMFFWKIGPQSSLFRIAFGQFVTLFCGLHDTWRSAIGSVLNFFVLNQIKPKKKKKKI